MSPRSDASERWSAGATENEPVRRWATEVIGHLRLDQTRALEREAEERW